MILRYLAALLLLLLLFVPVVGATVADEDFVDSLAVDTLMLARDAARPAPASDVVAKDTPNDNGGSIQIRWSPSSDDAAGKVFRYDVERKVAGSADETFEVVGSTPAGVGAVTDNHAKSGIEYVYRVVAINTMPPSAGIGEPTLVQSYSSLSKSVIASAQWFNTRRTIVLIFALVLGALIIYYISQAKAGKELFIRKIAGLEAVDEAVGRATEMGKKIFYIPGTQDMENIQTIAGVNILGRVAKLAAEYETDLDVPVSRSLVMVTAREIVKEAYLNAGRPDAFNEDMVHYLTDDQFGYAAAIDGMVVREQPATMFYMGAFYAESLILAETGNSIGAIQIAGTAMPAQLPFFVAACDYTLIGEELFAASAYLAKEPKLLGSLKGQDVGKGLILIVILIGVIIQTLGVYDFASLFSVPVD